jgi:hypothetical protein
LPSDVVEDHPHAQPFRQHADLGTDVAIADDAQHLVARFEAAGGGFGPSAAMAQCVFLRDATQQHDRLGDHQLGHAARIGIRRVEHGNAELARGVQIHLIGADAETADRDQPLGVRQHLVGELGARADADDVRVGNALLEFGLGQGFRMQLDLAVAGPVENLDAAGADAFQQQHLDVLAGVRGFHDGL